MAITISAIDAAINALVTDQRVSYQIGNKRVDNGDKIRQLMELRKHLMETPDLDISLVSFDWDIGLDGTDDTQTSIP